LRIALVVGVGRVAGVDANFEIKCSDCGTTYSADEPSCPHCQQPGMKMPNRKVEKIPNRKVEKIPNRKVEQPKASEKGKDSDESTWRWVNFLPDWKESLWVLGVLVAGGFILGETGVRYYNTLRGEIIIIILIVAGISFMVIRAISVLCWSGCVKFVGGNQSKKSKDDLDKEDPYSLATVEASGNGRNEGLWGKCFVEADGNETKTKVLYIKRRVEQLEESPLDLSQQEAEESLLHWWRRIMFVALAIGWFFATYEYRGARNWDWALYSGAIIGEAIGRCLGLMFSAWILAGLPWLFFKLTKNPLTRRGYILCFIAGCVFCFLANLVAVIRR
jgi:hypothetical protein